VHPDTEGQGGRPAGHQPQPGYTPPPGYAPPGYGVPPYGTPGYGTPGYGTPGYGLPGPASYPPPPGYGYGWNGPVPTAWPYGPDRPGIATAAAVLGFVTAGLTLLMSIFFATALGHDGSGVFVVLLFGIPCAIGMIVGGVRLLGQHTHQILLTSAIAAVLVLILALILGLGTFTGPDVVGMMIIIVLAAPLPIVTACLAGGSTVSAWVYAGQH